MVVRKLKKVMIKKKFVRTLYNRTRMSLGQDKYSLDKPDSSQLSLSKASFRGAIMTLAKLNSGPSLNGLWGKNKIT